jgi:LysM repeat protein
MMAAHQIRNRWAFLLTLLLLLVLALSACERQLQDPGDNATSEVPAIEEAEQPAETEVIGVDAPTAEATEPEPEPEDQPVTGIPADDPTPMVSEEEATATEESPRPADETAAEEEAAEEEAAEEAEEAAEPEAEEVEEAAGEETEEVAAEATETEETEEAEAAEAESAQEAAPTAAAQERIHVVQAGENLYRIGLQYGISWVVLADFNGLPNANAIYVGQELKIPADPSAETPPPTPPPSTPPTHVVQPGDNLYRIGQLYNISWVQIAQANGLVNPNHIYVGQVLTIPATAPAPGPQLTHTVQPRETLFLISLHYGVPWMNIASANNIGAPYVIYPGQTLVIPASGQ